MSNFKLNTSRVFKHPVEKIYQAWTKSEIMQQWYGPGDMRCADLNWSNKINTDYMVTFESPAGEKHIATGELKEAVENEKLVFTWGWQGPERTDSLVTVTFKPEGDGSLVEIVHEQLATEEAAQHHKMGWDGIMANCETFMSA